LRHAAAPTGGGDPRRHRQPARLVCRQLHYRRHLQLRTGAVARTRLLRPVPADGPDPAASPARAVRPAGVMTGKRIAIAITLVALATVPYWMPGSYYVNVASQILF